jgi:hypothetical protein
MSRRKVLIALVCGLVVAVVAAIAVHRAHGSPRAPLSRLSIQGRHVTPTRRAAATFHVDAMRLVAVRDGRAFYELDTANGRCFGVGSANAIGDPGGEACPAGAAQFPSPDRPIFDFSVYEARPGASHDQLTVYRLEGFAADGVSAVGVLNRAGKVSLRVPVADNVYVLDPIPPGLTGSVVPLDARGAPLNAPRRR